VIHKNINPSNIIWNTKTDQVKIIDFGIASRLPSESFILKNPGQLEGTLAYLSPEQTGRINRSIDYRTDLYSLGVTLYEMFTGQLPFTTSDTIELVHCHIAKKPFSVCEINTDIPPIISNIIMKLLEKNAEDDQKTYESAVMTDNGAPEYLDNTKTLAPSTIHHWVSTLANLVIVYQALATSLLPVLYLRLGMVMKNYFCSLVLVLLPQ